MSRAIEAGAKNCSPRRLKLVGKQNGLPCLPFGLAPMEAAIGSYNDENQKDLAIFGLVPMKSRLPLGQPHLK